MKRICIYISILLISLSSCSDFLDRFPLDTITEAGYFYTPDDLRTYMNGFYNTDFLVKYPNYGADGNSDNQTGIIPDTRLEGTRTVSTTGSISYIGYVRQVNYFFDRYKRVEENYSLDQYRQYLGEAHFFRALSYFNILQTYGGMHWVGYELNTDSPELYYPRDSRDVVATHIILDLDSAAMYLMADKTRGSGRINRWMALLIQSRVALYEGTWQKYHNETPFGVANANPDKYFQKAAEAALALMESGLYAVYSTGDPLNDYRELFALQDYSSNSEIMFWRV